MLVGHKMKVPHIDGGSISTKEYALETIPLKAIGSHYPFLRQSQMKKINFTNTSRDSENKMVTRWDFVPHTIVVFFEP